MGQLSGRIAIITGASKGLGKAMATALARAGATVALVSRNKEQLQACARELIDAGAEDIYEHEGEIIVETAFTDFGIMQKALEEKGLNVISAAVISPITRSMAN